jgi:phage terminase large subunit-like protein
VQQCPALSLIIVGVDPEASNTETSAETGIIVVGGALVNNKLHGYVLEDASIKSTPQGWATAAVTAFYKYKANYIVAEVNNGGDMVESTIQAVDPRVPVKKVHASRGKYTRAEPVSALYEQGRGHHVGFFPILEDQLCEWVPGDDSPDRLDAMVWAYSELLDTGEPGKMPEQDITKTNFAFKGVRSKEF